MTSGRPRIVVAPDKFKGSLTATEAADAIARGLVRGCPDAEIVSMPVADGGDGTVEAAVAAGYQRKYVMVSGPTGETVRASFAIDGADAVVEMAEASGIRLLPGGRPAPMTASTRGTGELLCAAMDAGARRIVLGVGGSATTDGGAGMVQALGVRLLDADTKDVAPGGASLIGLTEIDVAGLDPRVETTEIIVATDVTNPLLGPDGAAAVFGPQKGATESQLALLETALAHFAEVVRRDLRIDVTGIAGGGAAGGIAAGAVAFLGARITSGVALVLDLVGFADALCGTDLVITGEGSLDAQSLSGKTPVGVARAAAAAGIRVVALVGRLDVDAEQLAAAGIAEASAIVDIEPDTSIAQRDAHRLLVQLAERVGKALNTPQGVSHPGR